MNHNDMNMAKMKGVRLNQAHLEGAALNDAFLREAELNSANLVGAQLNRANLFMAQMNGAELFRAAFIDANTSLTAVRSTSFILTSGLTADNVNRMFGDNSTIPIESMEDRPIHWPTEDLNTLEFLQRWKAHLNATQ